MKVFGISDLHLDINPLVKDMFGDLIAAKNNILFEDNKSNILLIAGDLAEVRSFRPISVDGSEMAKTPNLDLRKICQAFKKVFIVFGNHEFYSGDINTAEKEFLEIFADVPNLVLLHNEVVNVEDKVTIIGTTLWTDMKGGNPEVMYRCQHGMNDYSYIMNTDGTWVKHLRPEDTVAMYKVNREFLIGAVEAIDPDDTKPVIVMTHMAPIVAHANGGRTGSWQLDYAYVATDLEDTILDNDEKVAVWFHGHTHDHKSTEVGNTVVVTNARGYYDREFSPILLLDTDPDLDAVEVNPKHPLPVLEMEEMEKDVEFA